jgi:hypothetical protein
MITTLTWTLLVVVSSAARPLVFYPDLATLADCERLQQAVVAAQVAEHTRCVQVNKIVGVQK